MDLATHSGTSGVAQQARSLSLVILCEQLLATQNYLDQLETELAQLIAADTKVASLKKCH